MRAIKVKPDTEAQGTAKRFTIGRPDDEISGAIYLKQGTKVPNAIILGFPEDMIEDLGYEEEGGEDAGNSV